MGKDRMESRRGRRAEVKSGAKQTTPGAGAKQRNVVQESSSRGKGPFYVVLAVIAVVAGSLIAYQAKRPTARVVTIDPTTPLPAARGYPLGSDSAPVHVLEFADFECPACEQFATLTEPDVRKRLIETGRIQVRFLDYPLDVHRNTWEASMAAACANEQGKFWAMHDALFNNQDRWNGEATNRPKGVLKGLAQSIGLDVPQWESCYDTQKYKLDIAANQKEGERRLVQSTPTFVIGSKMIPGALGYDTFKAYVDTALASGDTVSGLRAPPKRDTALPPGAPVSPKGS